MNYEHQTGAGVAVSPGYGAKLDSPPTIRRFEGVLNRLDRVIGANSENAERLEQLADRLGGPTPQEVKQGSNTPQPGNVAAALERFAEILESQAARAHSAIGRLETL